MISSGTSRLPSQVAHVLRRSWVRRPSRPISLLKRNIALLADLLRIGWPGVSEGKIQASSDERARAEWNTSMAISESGIV